MTGFKPKFDNVLVREIEPRERTKHGIIVPGGLKDEQIRRGEILAVGPGRHYDGVFIEVLSKPGELVIFEPHAGFEILIGDVEHIVMREGKICATYVEEKSSIEA